MKKQKLLPMIGCLALATAVYFNVKHALNDYGLRDNKTLHPEILAQAGTTNGGSSSGRGSGSNGSGQSTITSNPNIGKWVIEHKEFDERRQNPVTKECEDQYKIRSKFVCDPFATDEDVCGSTFIGWKREPVSCSDPLPNSI